MAKHKKDKEPLRIWKERVTAAQATLVEHCLCPLKPPSNDFVHEAEHFFYANGKRQFAKAQILCPRGLLPDDEWYLRKLLTLTLRQPEPEPCLRAGVRYLLRNLGLSESGRSQAEFYQRLRRLAAVVYSNEKFYDPIRREHRRVEFHFFDLDAPAEGESFRPWWIAWGSRYFDFAREAGGWILFDEDTVDSLRPASRRLYLWLQKLFRSNSRTPYVDVSHFCVNQLGFASGLRKTDFNKKLRACAKDLENIGAIRLPKQGLHCEPWKGNFRASFQRGPHFEERDAPTLKPLPPEQTAAYDSMKTIGLRDSAIRRLLREFGHGERITEWIEATLWIKEHRPSYFSTGPEAYFVGGIRSEYRPPDWYFTARRADQSKNEARTLERLGLRTDMPKLSAEQEYQAFRKSREGQERFSALMAGVFGSETQSDLTADEHMRREFSVRRPRRREPEAVGRLIQVPAFKKA